MAMTASAPTGVDLVWPSEPRARALAVDLYDSVARRPLVSVHNGLPARYLAEDLPITDPISLLISHDQGVQALLRSSGIRTEFTVTDGWRTEHASRQAFVLLWTHLVGVWAKPWMQSDGDETARLAGLPPFRDDQDPDAVYDALAVQLLEHPMYPRRVLAEANIGRIATSDDPTDNLHAHEVLGSGPHPRRPGRADLQPGSLPRPGSPGLAYGRRSAGRGDRHRHRGPRWLSPGPAGATRLLHQPRSDLLGAPRE